MKPRISLNRLLIARPAGLNRLGHPKGAIRVPREGEAVPRGRLRVSGWALSPDDTVSRVEVLVDGRTHGRARLGLQPPSLVDGVERPDAAICGFRYLIPPSAMPEDEQMTIGAVVHLRDGSRYSLPEVTVWAGAAEEPFSDSDGQAALLREHVSRIASHSVRPANGSIRLLVFANNFAYAGAQYVLLNLLQGLNEQPGISSVVVCDVDGPLRERFEGTSIPVHLTRNRFGFGSVTAYEETMAELAAWASPKGFNIVLANTMRAMPGIDLAERLRLPSVWAIHSSVRIPTWTVDSSQFQHRYVRERTAHAFQYASAVLFPAEATRRQYDHLGEENRFAVIPCGIDLSRIAAYRRRVSQEKARQDLGIPRQVSALLCLGKITPRKGQALLAQAFSLIAQNHPDARLYLVGDAGTEYSAALRHYVERAGQGRISVVPMTFDPYRWHIAADAFVCASDNESLPIAILEAMAFETPVLSTSVFGIPEAVRDGHTGYLCAPSDVAAMAKGMERMLRTGPEEREAMARAGAKRVRDRHDIQKYTARFRSLLEDLVKDPSALRAEALAQG